MITVFLEVLVVWSALADLREDLKREIVTSSRVTKRMTLLGKIMPLDCYFEERAL